MEIECQTTCTRDMAGSGPRQTHWKHKGTYGLLLDKKSSNKIHKAGNAKAILTHGVRLAQTVVREGTLFGCESAITALLGRPLMLPYSLQIRSTSIGVRRLRKGAVQSSKATVRREAPL